MSGRKTDWHEQIWADAGLEAPTAPVFRKVLEAAREKGREEGEQGVLDWLRKEVDCRARYLRERGEHRK